MNRSNGSTGRKINFFTILFLGIIILVLGAIAYYFTLLMVTNPTRYPVISIVPRSEKAIEQLSNEAQSLHSSMAKSLPTIGLLKSNYSKKLNPVWFNKNQALWINTLKELGINPKEITDDELQKGSLPVSVIILPENPVLTTKQIISLKDFLLKGGGLFTVRASGTKDEKGSDRKNSSILTEIVGSEYTGEIYPEIKTHTNLILKGNSPLSFNLPPGAQIGFTTEDHPIMVKVREKRMIADGYYESALGGLTRGPLWEKISESSGLVRGFYGKGRVVWLGFNIGAVAGDTGSQNRFKRLLFNSLLWLSKSPIIQLNNWPGDYNACAVISGDIEFQFENIKNLLPILKNEKVPSVFFLVADIAQKETKLVKAMAEIGEIGLHSFHHKELKGMGYEEQFKLLKKGKDILADLSEQEILGFRPPFLAYDENTIQALKELGIFYISSDPTLNTQVVPIIDKSGLVIFPTANRDDYDIIYRDSITKPENVFGFIRDDFERVYSLGGIYILNYHSQILGRKGYTGFFQDIIKYLKSKVKIEEPGPAFSGLGRGLWITNLTEVSRWWRLRSEIRLNTLEAKDSITINLYNNNREAVKDISFSFYPSGPLIRSKGVSYNYKGDTVQFGEADIGLDFDSVDIDYDALTGFRSGNINYYFDYDSKRVNIIINEFEPHSSINLTIYSAR